MSAGAVERKRQLEHTPSEAQERRRAGPCRSLCAPQQFGRKRLAEHLAAECRKHICLVHRAQAGHGQLNRAKRATARRATLGDSGGKPRDARDGVFQVPAHCLANALEQRALTCRCQAISTHAVAAATTTTAPRCACPDGALRHDPDCLNFCVVPAFGVRRAEADVVGRQDARGERGTDARRRAIANQRERSVACVRQCKQESLQVHEKVDALAEELSKVRAEGRARDDVRAQPRCEGALDLLGQIIGVDEA
mmetsp:Transcript_12424/g.52240  ORF Transcript_12424/g.52240 Transcript_12424/m.52240 type:complete len:252 (-) Transcript_12424:3718-4473(-)